MKHGSTVMLGLFVTLVTTMIIIVIIVEIIEES